jgi:hypothetical protein
LTTKPTICLRLDGLLATAGHRLGDPCPGAAEFTRRLAKDYRVTIYTSRVKFDLDLDRPDEPQKAAALAPIRAWLNEHKIWYDGIYVGCGSPEAALFVGPKELATPLNPTHDDFFQIEREIRTRVTSTR